MGRRARERYEARIRRERFARRLSESRSLDVPKTPAKDSPRAVAVMAGVFYATVLVLLVPVAWSVRTDVAESRRRMEASMSRMEAPVPAEAPVPDAKETVE